MEDNNAHLKLEIVLNDGEGEENEEEKRFNEIICYDSGDSDDGELVINENIVVSNILLKFINKMKCFYRFSLHRKSAWDEAFKNNCHDASECSN